MDDAPQKRARRALELGRLRQALIGASIVTLGLTLLARFGPGAVDARFLVLPFAAWAFVAWRGGALARGGMLGLLAGAIGWLVPMSVLRPCCAGMDAAMAGADCCTRPECCLEAGAFLGIAIAFLAPIDPARGKRRFAERVLGTLLIAGATLGVRCTGLFLGETLGLLGGLLLGTAAVGGVRAMLSRATVSG